MNRPIRRVAVVVTLLFLSLMLNLTYIQVVKGADYRTRQGNTRVLLAEYSRPRGPIVAGGAVIASSKATDDQLKYLRTYAAGTMYAPATGFYSITFGSTEVERAENGVLTGNDTRMWVRNFADLVTGRQARGGSVVLTLDPAAQKAAYDALAGRRGAVVALDPSTGAILALVSSPSYDPATVSTHSGSTNTRNRAALLDDPAQPMLNRPLRQTYAPGSTFKLVTAAAALSTGRYTKDSVIPGPAVLDLPQTTADLPNESGAACGPGGMTTLENALRISCNTAFGGLGLTLGEDTIAAQAEAFGFGQDPDVPLSTEKSVFPTGLNPPQLAQSAIGQFDVRATPLQMAMVTAAIANRGVVMTPYLVSEVRAPDLSVLERAEPKELSTAVTPAVARQLTDMMVTVVTSGTGTNGAIPGVSVAGKTGTAQQGGGRAPHAWFVSFAPAQEAKVAVAVVLEDGGGASEVSGNRLAAPIARAVMSAVLGR